MEFFSRCAVAVVVALLLSLPLTDSAQLKTLRKRQGSCDARYRKIERQHTACLAESGQSSDSGVSEQDKRDIVEEHNAKRRSVTPPASDMMMMSWDDGLANIAQKWADNCNFAHDKNYNRYDYGRFNVGQNLALGHSNWKEAIQAWISEEEYYDYDTNKATDPGKAVGHYTQVVWAKSIKVGCGFASCKNLQASLYVCNYGPAGNMQGEKPYTSGRSCGACPSSCNNNLCDCKGRVCKNGGTMDLNTCACACKPNFYEQPDCTLNCNSGNKEPRTCSQMKAYCKMASNAPQDCPVSCGWCPAASNA